MAKRTIDFDDYEGDQYDEYTGEDPRVGAWYTGEVVRGKYDGDKDQMIWFIQLVDNPDYEGWVKGFYAPFDGGGKFKSQDFARAIQGGQQKPLSFDPESDAQIASLVKKAPRIKFRTGEYNDRVTIEKVRAILSEVGGTKTTAAKATAPKAAPAPAPALAAVPDEEELEDYTEEELTDLSVEELEEILQEEFDTEEGDLPAKPRRDPGGKKYKAALIEDILAAQEEGDEEDTPEAAAEGDAEFDDGFAEDDAEPEPEPTPAPRARRSRAAAKPEPEPEPAPTTTRAVRRRR